ncbi:MAG TPA: DUF885 domain-containing protein [Acidimicrobiia bacterium]|nr:DUF885 domain-containing protein [Acidimicrobiia bacterium]
MTTAFELADQIVDAGCALDPVLCTQLGIPGSDHEWGDSFGLAGVEQRHRLHQRFRPLVEPHASREDPSDRIAARVMLSAFDESSQGFAELDHFRDLRHMGSSFHKIRMTFDVMRHGTPEERDHISRRLDTLEKPLGDYRELLEAGISAGVVVAARQVRSVIEQARRISRQPSSIDDIVNKAQGADGPSAALTAAADRARSAYEEFADWLERRYLPVASGENGVAPETYARSADRLVGMPVDLDEAYRWGWHEFDRLRDELKRVAELIRPGEGVLATKDYLEIDPAETAAGPAELISFVERTLAGAVDDLAGTHFDVPAAIRPLTVQMAPAGGPLGVYYRRPSEDLSRPGGVWYSIGDQQVFPLYQHVSTAYHEGFPGHHLQIATAMHRRDRISRFQRLLTWCPGYGEGWAMYAEVLMGELGYLEDPRYYFGMLAKQMYRAARVVVDIGLHLRMPIDRGSPLAPGESWSYETAVEFMRVYGFRTPDQARDEVLRYLGWPAQAITYKLGERKILRMRETARAHLGSQFDLRSFHSNILQNGTMRLDLLDEVVGWRLGE